MKLTLQQLQAHLWGAANILRGVLTVDWNQPALSSQQLLDPLPVDGNFDPGYRLLPPDCEPLAFNSNLAEGGWAFTKIDFVTEFGEVNIHKSLSSLARAGKIRRVCHGVYSRSASAPTS